MPYSPSIGTDAILSAAAPEMFDVIRAFLNDVAVPCSLKMSYKEWVARARAKALYDRLTAQLVHVDSIKH